MSGITKATVESAVTALNDKAERMGMDRRFAFQPGSNVNGIQHVLEEHHPALSHPNVTKIGKTLAEAHGYVLAMNHALLSAAQDRQLRRDAVRYGAPLPVHDPDARSVRRASEESAGRYPQDGRWT